MKGRIHAGARLLSLAALSAIIVATWWNWSSWFSADAAIERHVAELVSSTGGRRFTESRLRDFEAWAPLPSLERGATLSPLSKSTLPIAAQVAALRLRDRAERVPSAAGRRRLGVAHLALGQAALAVAAFEEAVAIAPEDAAARTDLAAGLIERWRTTGQPADLIQALDTTEFALARVPGSGADLFNQALALEKLSLKRQARRVWEAYRRSDAQSAWTAEAAERLNALAATGGAFRPPAAGAGDAAFDAAVAASPLAAYRYIENEVLRDWAGAVLADDGKSIDVGSIAIASGLAEALRRSHRDAYVSTLVRRIRESDAWPRARQRDLALGVDGLLRWRASIDAGQYQEAEPLARQARGALSRAAIDPIEADFDLAYSHFVGGRAAAALPRLRQIETQARRLGYSRLAARAVRLQALDAMLGTRVAEAQTRYEAGLDLANRSGDAELSTLFHTFLAEAFGQQGDFRSAWQHLVQTFDHVDTLHSMRQRFDVLNAAAILARRAGLHHASLRFANELLAETHDWTNPEGAIGGRLNRARAMADLSAGDRGVSDLDEAEALLPALQTRPQAQARLRAEIDAHRAFSMVGHNDRGALKAASAAIAYFDDSVRVRLAELLLQRGRIYKRLGELTSAKSDWTRGVRIVEDQRPALRTELLRVSRTAAFWDLFVELIDAESTNPQTALALAERARTRELVYSLAPDQSPEAFSLAHVRMRLTGGTQAIVFSQLPTRLLIWLVDESTITMTERQVTATQVQELVRRFVRSLDSADDAQAGEQLARLLLPDRVNYRAHGRIIFVPDGVLHGVPFAALPVPGQRTLLVESSVPLVAPSLSTFALAMSRAAADPVPHLLAVGVGDAAPADSLPALPYVAREIATVAERYTGRSQTLSGASASTAEVTSALGSAAIVHFAGHAVFDPMFPARSRLVLSDGGLTPPAIAAAGVKPGATIVLSACDTARGQTYRGEGPMSLVRAFLAAGASTVVATLWQVRDDDAFSVVTIVHRALAEGIDAPESLARAQRQLIARGAARSSWAGFAAIGGGRTQRKDS